MRKHLYWGKRIDMEKMHPHEFNGGEKNEKESDCYVC